MQLFKTLCTVHKSKYLYERSLRRYMKEVFSLSLSHTEMICIQYIIHNPGISLYELSKISSLDLPHVSQIVGSLTRKEMVIKTKISVKPLKYSLSLSQKAAEICDSYREDMRAKILDTLDTPGEIDEINSSIRRYHLISEKLKEAL